MRKVRELVAVLILLSLITLIFVLRSSITENQSKNTLTTKLPTSTIYYIRFDAVDFFKELSTVALFDVRDQEFFTRVKEKIDNQKDESSTWMNMGVDNLAPIELLVCDIDDRPIVFLRFKVINQDEFLNFAKDMNKPTIVKDNFGYIPIQSIIENSKVSRILSQQFNFEFELKNSGELLIFEFEKGSPISTHAVNHEESEISIFSALNKTKISPRLIPEGIGIELSWQPTTTEKKWLSKIDTSLHSFISSIDYISASYSGFKFIDDSSIPGIPQGSLLLSFTNPVSIPTVLSSVSRFVNSESIEIRDNKLIFSNNVSLYCHTLSPKEIALSFSSSPPIIKKLNVSTKYFGGSLNAILNFENPGYYQYIIDAVPGKAELQRFLSSTRRVNFENSNDFEGKTTISIEKPSGFYSGLLKLFSLFI
ncbi:MAG: hypothetical protein ACKO5W_03845 [Crocinitomicaceae bacterium]